MDQEECRRPKLSRRRPPPETPEAVATRELARKRVRVQHELEALNVVMRRAVWDLYRAGWSHGQIGRLIGVTKGRVQQLVQEERREREARGEDDDHG